MSQNEVIQVVLSVYDKSGTYSCHAGVVLTSLFSNTKNPVNVTILYDDTLTDDNRSRFIRTGERFGQSVSFVDVGEHISRVAEDLDKVRKAFGLGALFRLLVPELILISKVIYLDCDIVVNLDMADLWNADTGDTSIGAVKDPWIKDVDKSIGAVGRQRRRTLGYTSNTYFNSGVLVLNLDKLRARHDLCGESFEFFSRYAHIAINPDQDFLNFCCAGDVTYLDARFNYMRWDGYHARTVGNTIIHFAGYPPKVWERFPRIPQEFLYWKYFLASEWSDRMLDVMEEGVSDRKEKPNPPFPVDRVPASSSIVLYGAGGLGRAWYHALKLVKHCRVILWVDKRADELEAPVMDVSKMKRAKYDYVVIAVSSSKIAREIAADIVSNYGVAPEKIVFVKKERTFDYAGAR